MSDFIGNDDVRRTGRFSERDIERLLSGHEPADEELLPLAAFLAEFRAESLRPHDEEQANLHLTVAMEALHDSEASGSTVTTEPEPGTLIHRPRRRPMTRLRRRLVAASAALVLLFAATGVATAANDAHPGQAFLYGLDQAMETFGILNGGATERLQEAQDLVESGDVADSLDHAADAVADVGADAHENGDSSNASEALRAAAENVRAHGDEVSQDVRDEVGLLLEYLAEARATGHVDGSQVAEMARGIGGPPDPLPGPPDPLPGPPETIPGPAVDTPAS